MLQRCNKLSKFVAKTTRPINYNISFREKAEQISKQPLITKPLWFKNSCHKGTQRFFTKEHKACHFVLSDSYNECSLAMTEYFPLSKKTLRFAMTDERQRRGFQSPIHLTSYLTNNTKQTPNTPIDITNKNTNEVCI